MIYYLEKAVKEYVVIFLSRERIIRPMRLVVNRYRLNLSMMQLRVIRAGISSGT